ncbi:MAG: hypothetical protein P2A85_10650 [Microcoleus anatoxicus]|uniref:hypothetical protein n=1 Tax=Microcoleus anatoxicus TaxID=2705319 RepID=UPI00366C05A0
MRASSAFLGSFSGKSSIALFFPARVRSPILGTHSSDDLVWCVANEFLLVAIIAEGDAPMYGINFL